MVLLTGAKRNRPAATYDHLDDLESFFWVFYYILFAYEAPRVPASEIPADVLLWNSGDPKDAYKAKQGYLSLDREDAHMFDERWGPVCKDLLVSLVQYFNGIYLVKKTATYDNEEEDETQESDDSDDGGVEVPRKPKQTIENLRAGYAKQYKRVLRLFEKAIKQLPSDATPRTPVKSRNVAQPRPDGDTSRVWHPTHNSLTPHRNGLKRGSDSDGDGESPSLKKQRQAKMDGGPPIPMPSLVPVVASSSGIQGSDAENPLL